MAHSHETHQVSASKLVFTIILNGIITAAQIVGGIVSGSLALISDAVHNLSDMISVILAYIAQLLGQKPSTRKSTFGYKRAEILAAFINALALIGISIFLVFEAIDRLSTLPEVDAKWMFWLGLLGLIANGISVLILEKEKNKSINIKAAYLHLLGDALTSLAVILGAVLIWFYEIYWIDPVVTILISIYLFVHTIKLLKESVTILMQMAPADLHIDEIEKRLMELNDLKDVHHIHLWNLTDKLIHFECHIILKDDIKVSETNKLFRNVQRMLHDEFDIEHVTIQFEYDPGHCKDCD
ncbi:cation diffusion facilitator family transporter [Maribellus comscasis]|uniref:Cation diffusion facilitator family transporter n=1 Tax=Maribellus comscasis TaxID=2681766 RepID=A0A6I6JJ69_9BACT|nr:cation diffusion facilitator family transporter [Maribellus comscasis]QGY42905.1 cation diffusion facilitator family transporter [Maribellus comscasis]